MEEFQVLNGRIATISDRCGCLGHDGMRIILAGGVETLKCGLVECHNVGLCSCLGFAEMRTMSGLRCEIRHVRFVLEGEEES